MSIWKSINQEKLKICARLFLTDETIIYKLAYSDDKTVKKHQEGLLSVRIVYSLGGNPEIYFEVRIHGKASGLTGIVKFFDMDSSYIRVFALLKYIELIFIF